MAKQRGTPPAHRKHGEPGTPGGHMPKPHGTTPWHFKHGNIEGNGFNGGIRHLFKTPTNFIPLPGKGFMQNHTNK